MYNELYYFCWTESYNWFHNYDKQKQQHRNSVRWICLNARINCVFLRIFLQGPFMFGVRRMWYVVVVVLHVFRIRTIGMSFVFTTPEAKRFLFFPESTHKSESDELCLCVGGGVRVNYGVLTWSIFLVRFNTTHKNRFYNKTNGWYREILEEPLRHTPQLIVSTMQPP